jgi:hypothetical protein
MDGCQVDGSSYLRRNDQDISVTASTPVFRRSVVKAFYGMIQSGSI